MFGRSSPRFPWFLVFAAAILIAGQCIAVSRAEAQTFDATNLRQPTDLGMTWLVHAGDDPAYAQPSFDDSHWTRFDPHGSLLAIFAHRRSPVVWYRLHIKVAPNQKGLALAEWQLASALEIYVNGRLLIRSGSVSPYAPYTFSGHLLRPIPDSEIATGSLVVAVRTYISPLEWAEGPGLYVNNLTFGQQAALSDRTWLTVVGANALTWFSDLSGIGLGIVALALFAAQRNRREYLWIFLLFFSTVAQLPLALYELFHTIPAVWELTNVPFRVGYLVFLTMTYFALLRIPLPRWMQYFLGASAVGQAATGLSTLFGFGSSLTLLLAATPMAALVAGIIPSLLIREFRRGNREAGILLLPALLLGSYIYFELVVFLGLQIPALASSAVHLQNAVYYWNLGPFTLQAPDLCGCLFVLSLAVIIVLRATRITHQQALLESELAAAQEVQQVILPEQVETVPGFKVESIYQPAEQVGGDFFQILPAGEGGMLAVIGDVAGKGLPAAMLVSMIVGTIRGVAEYTSTPAELLANMNERLVGRAGGFSTALAALIAADGSVTLASAGHLPPYLDGKEVDLPSALPLGVRSGATYETARIRIEPGSRLTFYSDGIVEAKKQNGEMFGFERARQFSMQPVAAIVSAARQFGQQDDMTVVWIERVPAPVSTTQMAFEPAPLPAV
ncbi:MAG TPA: PP2C family protein-serine/threonine phosphatase [Terracidiphilus sp.]|nr:PP2C family protein-serine/threonine phosphatase [Terracidiphilus sp.]